ncbi:MAG: DUF4340 domain-containing protein [Sandaracinaceae bacterium]|nr:MAG: DUF4340 domain-containing protein [Sandaracinaceae bacterium]
MSKRTTIVLAVLNAALLGFILLYEQGTLSTSDVARRSGQVLRRFVRERVDHVELIRDEDAPIVFDRERTEDDELGDSLGTWTLTAPVESAADDDAVDSLLSALEWLDARRTLEGVADEDRARMGLDEPRFVVRFRVMDEEVALRIGGEAPTGDGVYAAVDGEDRAYVVGTDFVESIDHDVDHFRDKDLFAGFYGTDARQITLGGGVPELRFERDGVWRVRAPVRGWADASKVDRLLRGLRDLRATRFLDERPDDLGPYGLDTPWRALTVTRAEGETATLLVGEPCGEHADERYARAATDEDGEGPVVCVRASDVQMLELDPESVRATSLLTLGDDAIERVEVGALTLRRGETTWELQVGEGEPSPADDAAIAAWLGALRDARVRRFEPVDGEPGHGLGSPTATVTFHRSDDDQTLVLHLGEVDADGAWVRRGDEEALTLYDAAVADALRPTPLRFRARQLVSLEPGDARSLGIEAGSAAGIEAGGLTERATRGEGGTWTLEAPSSMEADRVVVRDIARRLATLAAERFVAEAPAAEHGLRSPSRVVTARFEPAEEGGEPTDLRLAFGAETVEGTYARLDEGPVFIASAELVDAVERSLASLDALTVPIEDLTSIRLERGPEQTELTRDGTTWQLAGGGTPNPDRTRALLDRLSTLRASRVLTHGAQDASLASPPLRVVATRRDGSTVSLSFGPEITQDGEALVPARRDGVPVTYGFRPELLESILDFAP